MATNKNTNYLYKMKASDFVKILRKVIKEEVRAVVKEELNSFKPVMTEIISKQVKKQAKFAEHAPVMVENKPTVKRTQPIVSMDDFSSLLNEGIDEDEWPDMNGGPMTSDFFSADSDFGINGFSQQQVQQVQQVHRAPSSTTTGFKDPLLRDYSSVLKAADEHAQGFRP